MVITTSKMLSHALRETRYQQRLSQIDLAKLASIKQSTISSFENNSSNIKIETLFKILASLELELVVQPRPKHQDTKDEYGDVW
ncbi:helix-turn-helix domain-containing protein [Ursidibacter sp. B-7004-1]